MRTCLSVSTPRRPFTTNGRCGMALSSVQPYAFTATLVTAANAVGAANASAASAPAVLRTRWPPHRIEPSTSNPHSRVAFSRHRHTPRGFLPWGLSNTCPRLGAMRDAVPRDGQLSDNPKQERPIGNDRFPQRAVCVLAVDVMRARITSSILMTLGIDASRFVAQSRPHAMHHAFRTQPSTQPQEAAMSIRTMHRRLLSAADS